MNAALRVTDDAAPHSVSIVIPVYRGEQTLPSLIAEIAPLVRGFTTPLGRLARVSEVILVHDNGPDNSDVTIRKLAAQYPWVKAVWLSRNSGQHAATMAGMEASTGEWIVTIDEDGIYDPGQIGVLLDAAMQQQASIVYADPINETPRTGFRNITSKASKVVIDAMTGSKEARKYHSYRLMLGDVGRQVARSNSAGVYLDIALGWATGPAATAPIMLRQEADRPSGYNLRRLLSHFWSMVLTSGTRVLRFVAGMGLVLAALGLLSAIGIVIFRLYGGAWPQGWATLMVTVLVIGGIILFILGVLAEYLGVVVYSAMGKPPYVVVSDFAAGPLGRDVGKPNGT